MIRTLEIAFSKMASLPEAAQEQIGRELLERIDTLAQLRSEIEIGIRQLDAGLGRPLDVEEFLRQAHEEHGRGK